MLRLLSFAIFGVIFLAALLLTYFILIIDKIEVYGCERFTEEEILAASGLHTGQHMWLANLNAAVEAVEEDPYIASLEITSGYPWHEYACCNRWGRICAFDWYACKL